MDHVPLPGKCVELTTKDLEGVFFGRGLAVIRIITVTVTGFRIRFSDIGGFIVSGVTVVDRGGRVVYKGVLGYGEVAAICDDGSVSVLLCRFVRLLRHVRTCFLKSTDECSAGMRRLQKTCNSLLFH